MLRKTLTILSLIGLLLSVGLWGVSYYRIIYTQLTNGSVVQYGLVWGAMTVVRMDQEALRQIGEGRLPQPGVRTTRVIGQKTIWKPHCDWSRRDFFTLTLPFWPLVVFFCSTLWFAWMPLYRHRKRKKLGLCLSCGYDLQGSKDICPECASEFSN